MRSSQYLKHIAKMERAATKRAGWMRRRRECYWRGVAKRRGNARAVCVLCAEAFRAIAKEMRARSGNSSHVFGDKFFDGRVRKWLAEARMLEDMGFNLGAAVMAMETKGGRTDECVT